MVECEGFICPLCMRDFRGVPQLEQHFQDEHSETTQSRFRSNLKTLFGKFKRRNQDGEVDEGAAAASSREDVADGGVVTNVSGIDPSHWEQQQFGFSRDHMMVFRRERDVKITQTAAETNRLIIRVERLFRVLQDTTPRTSKARKEMEQSVVYWRPDKDEKRCLSCGRGFNLRRRKHHCRLCGSIICKQCSQFMTLSETYPVLSDCPDFSSLTPPIKTRVLPLRRGSMRLRRGRREEGEGEGEDEDDESSQLRMCSNCQKLIHRKLQQLQSLEKPDICILYEKMQLIIDDADSLKPSYLHMAQSIIAGDYGYRLHDAMSKRQQLIKLYEAIDGISKDILSLVTSDPSTSQRMLKLCRGIRGFASTYLQENLLTLPSLPTMQKLAEIRETKEREAQQRLQVLENQREVRRQQELAARGPAHATVPSTEEYYEESAQSVPGPSTSVALTTEKKNRFEKLKNFSTKVIPKVHFKRDAGGGDDREGSVRVQRLNSGSGWMGTSRAFGSVDSQDDPFTLQRQQLVSFIQQAREAGRMDEVAALEKSLCEIEDLMERQPDSGSPIRSYGFD